MCRYPYIITISDVYGVVEDAILLPTDFSEVAPVLERLDFSVPIDRSLPTNVNWSSVDLPNWSRAVTVMIFTPGNMTISSVKLPFSSILIALSLINRLVERSTRPMIVI